MKIEVLFFGWSREMTGTARKMVTVSDGMKLVDFFRLLDRRYNTRFTEELQQKKGLMVIINGRHYSSIGGLDTPLNNKDTVAIMPAVIGG